MFDHSGRILIGTKDVSIYQLKCDRFHRGQNTNKNKIRVIDHLKSKVMLI